MPWAQARTLAQLGNPVLHAKTLSFMHPMTETTLRVEAPLDEALEQALSKLTRK